MSRLVQPGEIVRVRAPGSRGNFEATGETTALNVGGDNYGERIQKYIPAEVLAAYLALDRMTVPDVSALTKFKTLLSNPTATAASDTLAKMRDAGLHDFHVYMPLVVFVVGLLFTPLYIWNYARNAAAPTPWVTQAVMSTTAFAVWAYAIQGNLFTTGFPVGLVGGSAALSDNMFNGMLASLAVVVFTLASGIFAPAPISAR